jgi:hypothetical protein
MLKRGSDMSPEELDDLAKRIKEKTGIDVKIKSEPPTRLSLPIEEDDPAEESQ